MTLNKFTESQNPNPPIVSMADGERKEWRRGLPLAIRIFFAFILFLMILFGFIVKPDGAGSNIDVEFLWDAMHPASLINWLGFILSLGFMFALSGLPILIWDFDPLQPPGSTWYPKALFAGGVLGVILMFV